MAFIVKYVEESADGGILFIYLLAVVGAEDFERRLVHPTYQVVRLN